GEDVDGGDAGGAGEAAGHGARSGDFLIQDFGGLAAVIEEGLGGGDNADGDDVVLEGDVPEPAVLVGEGEGGGGAFVVALLAQAAFVVGEDGGFAEARVAGADAELSGEEGGGAGGVDDDAGVNAGWRIPIS